MNDIATHLIIEALRREVLTITLEHENLALLKVHVLGLSFTLARVPVQMEPPA